MSRTTGRGRRSSSSSRKDDLSAVGNNSAPSILIRCDATPALGGGHVMRCLTLANALAKAGWRVRFACVAGTATVVSALARSGFDIIELINPLDAAQLVGKLRKPFDAIVFDQYDIDANYERALRPFANMLVVIDDLADRRHDCDLLIDQTFGRTPEDYRSLLPADAQILTGSQYALLRPEFAQARPRALARHSDGRPVKRILVSMGLTDPGGITEKVLNAVPEADTGMSVDVVAGSRAPGLPAVQELAARHPNVTVHIDAADICSLMIAADLAIGGAGTTTWERCCLGLPTIIWILADNQRLVANALGKIGAAYVVDDLNAFAEALAKMLRSPTSRQSLSAAAAALTDGHGTDRIVDSINSKTTGRARAQQETSGICPTIRVRRAQDSDSRNIWVWRNDPATRHFSKNSEPVTWARHSSWLRALLFDSQRILLIAEIGGMPVGVVRFDRHPGNETRYITSINLKPDAKGKGLGRKVLAEGCQYIAAELGAVSLEAHISKANEASRRIFVGLGFKPLADHVDGEYERYVLDSTSELLPHVSKIETCR